MSAASENRHLNIAEASPPTSVVTTAPPVIATISTTSPSVSSAPFAARAREATAVSGLAAVVQGHDVATQTWIGSSPLDLVTGPLPDTPTVEALLSSVTRITPRDARVLVPVVAAYGGWSGLAVELHTLDDQNRRLVRVNKSLERKLQQAQHFSATGLVELTRELDTEREEYRRVDGQNQRLRKQVGDLRAEVAAQRSTIARLQTEVTDSVTALAERQEGDSDVTLMQEAEKTINTLQSALDSKLIEQQTTESQLAAARAELAAWKNNFLQLTTGGESSIARVSLASESIPSGTSSPSTITSARETLERSIKRVLTAGTASVSKRLKESPAVSSTSSPAPASAQRPSLSSPASTSVVTATSALPRPSLASTVPTAPRTETDTSVGDLPTAGMLLSRPATAVTQFISLDSDDEADLEKVPLPSTLPPFAIVGGVGYAPITQDEATVQVLDLGQKPFTLYPVDGQFTAQAYVRPESAFTELLKKEIVGNLRHALQSTGLPANDSTYADPLATQFRQEHPTRPTVSLGAVSNITKTGYEALYSSKPWNTLLAFLPRHTRTFDFAQLDPTLQSWVKGFFVLVFRYRRELWERTHWLPLTKLARQVDVQEYWDPIYSARKHRQAAMVKAFKEHFVVLQRVHAERLPRCFLFEPAFPILNLNKNAIQVWNPKSTNLISDLDELDAKEPERTHWVDFPGGHPFYRHSLARWYRCVYPLPASAFPSTWAAWIRQVTLFRARQLATITAAPAVLSLNYVGGLLLSTKFIQHQQAAAESESKEEDDEEGPLVFSDDASLSH